jgi:hypothetical protein
MKTKETVIKWPTLDHPEGVFIGFPTPFREEGWGD